MDFISNIVVLLREAADACYSQIIEIPFLYLPQKPQGAMSTMVRASILLLYILILRRCHIYVCIVVLNEA